MKTLKAFILLTAFLFSITGWAAEKIYKVGIASPIAPFVIVGNETYSGIAADIWQTIANNEKINYQYVVLNHNTDAAIQALAHGDIDVLIGPVSISHARYKVVDFSYPFFLNQIGVIEHRNPTNLQWFGSVFLDIITSPFLIGILVLFLIFVHVYWLAERKRAEDMVHGYRKDMDHVIWSHLLQKAWKPLPATLGGKLASFAWTLAAAVLVTALFATVTSKLTLALATAHGEFYRVSDLQDQTIAAVKGTHAVIEAEKIGARVVPADTVDQAMQWLAERKVAAVVDDYVLANYYLDTHDYPQLQMSQVILANDPYAIAVRKNSPLLAKINSELLFLQDNDTTEALCTKYIGPGAKACNF